MKLCFVPRSMLLYVTYLQCLGQPVPVVPITLRHPVYFLKGEFLQCLWLSLICLSEYETHQPYLPYFFTLNSMTLGVIPLPDDELENIWRWVDHVPWFITRIFPFSPYFFYKHQWFSVCAKRWWDVENFVPMGISCSVIYYTQLPLLTLIILLTLNIYDSLYHTIHWWNIDTLFRWVYLVPIYITCTFPFLPWNLIIKGINDSASHPTRGWKSRKSVPNDSHYIPL